MRTKLFLAFIFIILLALLSNVVFEKLIIGDFKDFVQGTEEDHIYWIMASIEGNYSSSAWNKPLLSEALHWGLMLGFETYVEDESGNRILSSGDVLSSMNPNMLNRMKSLLRLSSGTGDFTWYPLYIEGKEIGKLFIRPIEKLGSIPLKEEIFKKRGKEFLIISFLIAGGGASLLALLLTMYLSHPVRRLTVSAEKIAKGDFSVQEPMPHKKLKDEIDRLTDSFNYMAEALRREDSLRKHLTANIAHELRTPLTVIKGSLEAIEDGIMSDTEKVMKNIRSEIQRIISLVEGIEDITSAEASFFKKGTLEEIDLKEFVESMAGGMRKIIEEKGLYLRTDGSPVVVKTYPEKLHIILKNLLANAYKFTDKGGITISWDEYRRNESAGFYLSVEDTGKGIGKDELSRVFDRFYKGSTSAGKGLGLAIVRELTEVIGGKVEVESKTDQGSRFTVVFDLNGI
jgi:two-component system sensor histidine kinase BaeS